MSFDLERAVNLVATHGPVVRVVIAQTRGSVPREAGADMWVWRDGQHGTIGGGTLEFQAVSKARNRLDGSGARIWGEWHALGPDLGQCCGGQVHLVSEIFECASLPEPHQDVYIRRIGPVAENENLDAVKARYFSQNTPEIWIDKGVLVEPFVAPKRPLWIWGAGHVGRALVSVCAPLPNFAITWVDTSKDRFPNSMPQNVDQLVAADPARLTFYAPRNAEHFILTYSHEFDLRICDQLLRHEFDFAGLIGSRTKWARFRKRLADLGHDRHKIDRITCPIGSPNLGKHPFAIAIGVANCLLERKRDTEIKRNATG